MNDEGITQYNPDDLTGSEGVTDVNAGQTEGVYDEGTITAETAPEPPAEPNPDDAPPEPDPAPDPEPATEGDAPAPEPTEAEAVDPDRAEQVRIQNTSIDPSTGSTMQAEGRQPLGISPSE